MTQIQIVAFLLAFFGTFILANEFSNYSLNENKINLDLFNKKITFVSKSDQGLLLIGKLGLRLGNNPSFNIRNNNDSFKQFEFNNKKSIVEFRINLNEAKNDENITCTSFAWSFKNRQSKLNSFEAEQEFEDCFKIDTSYWYGGSEMKNQQFWPINNQVKIEIILNLFQGRFFFSYFLQFVEKDNRNVFAIYYWFI
jgi:hypothetical protein